MPLLEQQLRLRVQTLGNARVKPKHHWCFDIAECMLQGDPMLLDTFGTERLHRRVKSIAENCKSLVAYESYVMAGVTNVHMNSLEFPGWGLACAHCRATVEDAWRTEHHRGQRLSMSWRAFPCWRVLRPRLVWGVGSVCMWGWGME